MIPNKIELNELKSLLDNLKTDPENFSKIYILNLLEKNWENIVGPGFVNLSYPKFINDDSLTIFISHDSYRMELLFIKELILKNCNKFTGSYSIKTLKFKKGNVKLLKKKRTIKKADFSGKDNLLNMLEDLPEDETKIKLKELIGYL